MWQSCLCMTDITLSLSLPKFVVLLCECKYYENFLGRFHVVIVVAVSSCFANAEYKISCGVKSEFCTLRRTSDFNVHGQISGKIHALENRRNSLAHDEYI